MPTEQAVRWNIKVSKETDLSLRSFLVSKGIKRADRAKFIEQAVLWQVLRRTVEDIHTANRDADPEQVQAEMDTAIREVRTEARERNVLRRRRA